MVISIMKKTILISLSGLLIGTVFALVMFKNVKTNVEAAIKETKTATVFQVGVFSVYDNVLKEKNKYDYAYAYKDNDIYRVILAIYQDEEIISNLKKYYQNKNINIYLKEIIVSDKFYEELKKFEDILKETNDEKNYVIANKNILKKFDELYVPSN